MENLNIYKDNIIMKNLSFDELNRMTPNELLKTYNTVAERVNRRARRANGTSTAKKANSIGINTKKRLPVYRSETAKNKAKSNKKQLIKKIIQENKQSIEKPLTKKGVDTVYNEYRNNFDVFTNTEKIKLKFEELTDKQKKHFTKMYDNFVSENNTRNKTPAEFYYTVKQIMEYNDESTPEFENADELLNYLDETLNNDRAENGIMTPLERLQGKSEQLDPIYSDLYLRGEVTAEQLKEMHIKGSENL